MADASDAAAADAGADVALGWSDQQVEQGLRAAEFFEAHQRRVEAEDAENQLIAVGVGLAIGLVIVIAVRLRKSS